MAGAAATSQWRHRGGVRRRLGSDPPNRNIWTWKGCASNRERGETGKHMKGNSNIDPSCERDKARVDGRQPERRVPQRSDNMGDLGLGQTLGDLALTNPGVPRTHNPLSWRRTSETLCHLAPGFTVFSLANVKCSVSPVPHLGLVPQCGNVYSVLFN